MVLGIQLGTSHTCSHLKLSRKRVQLRLLPMITTSSITNSWPPRTASRWSGLGMGSPGRPIKLRTVSPMERLMARPERGRGGMDVSRRRHRGNRQGGQSEAAHNLADGAHTCIYSHMHPHMAAHVGSPVRFSHSPLTHMTMKPGYLRVGIVAANS